MNDRNNLPENNQQSLLFQDFLNEDSRSDLERNRNSIHLYPRHPAYENLENNLTNRPINPLDELEQIHPNNLNITISDDEISIQNNSNQNNPPINMNNINNDSLSQFFSGSSSSDYNISYGISNRY